MSKKEILLLGLLLLGTLTFAGGDLNLSSEIPTCSEKIVDKYQGDSQTDVKALIVKIRENEKLIEDEYQKPQKDWSEIERLTKVGGELKGQLEYLILARN